MSQMGSQSSPVMTTPSSTPTNPSSLKIISGGQTGADRAGLDVAIARGLPHGGWCPKGRKAEDGPLPARYQLTETQTASYLVRTERNVIDSDATVIFTLGVLAGGSKRTADFAKKHRRPYLHLQLVEGREEHAAQTLASFSRLRRVTRLNVAGSRETKDPGIHAQAGKVLGLALDLLGFPLPERTPEFGHEPSTSTPSDPATLVEDSSSETAYLTLDQFNELYRHRMHHFFVALKDSEVSDSSKQFLNDCGPILMGDAVIGDILPYSDSLVSFYRQHGFSICVSWCDGLVSIRVEKDGKTGQVTGGMCCKFKDTFHNLGETFDDLLVESVSSISGQRGN